MMVEMKKIHMLVFSLFDRIIFFYLKQQINYLGLDADYVEYLKLKKQKEFEAEQTLTTEQRQSMFFIIFNIDLFLE